MHVCDDTPITIASMLFSLLTGAHFVTRRGGWTRASLVYKTFASNLYDERTEDGGDGIHSVKRWEWATIRLRWLLGDMHGFSALLTIHTPYFDIARHGVWAWGHFSSPL